VSAGDLDRLLLLLTIQAGVIIGVSRLLGVLFRRYRQPQVIGEVVAGILLGPSLLGWAAPEVSAALFPHESLPFLKIVAEVGIVFFMFLIGLELNPLLLRNRGRAAAVISGTSIFVPFVLGATTAVVLYRHLAVPDVSRLAFAAFLGAAMAITAFPVLARILIERDMLHSPLGALTLTCAAVDDIAGWCLLSCIAAFGHARGGLHVITILGWLAVFLVVLLGAVRPLVRRLAALYESRGSVSQNMLATIFVLLLASALATQWIGIHAIFGAFVLGAVMPKDGGFVRDLSEKIEDFTTVFFLPIYFAYTGLRTEVTLLDTPAAWLMCAALIAVAVAGKFGGSVIAARAVGLEWRESAALGALVNTRGLMELIILNLGFDLGLITPTVFAMMVLMAVLTTMMTAPALARIDPHGHLQSTVVIPESGVAGPGTVLIPVALSSSGPHLLDIALALAEPDRPRIYALHVARPAERGALGARVRFDGDGRDDTLDPLLAHARARGVEVRPLVVTSRHPAAEICDVARLKDARLIVMGWHKPVFSKSVLGGTLERVMRRSRADLVILVDKGLDATPQRILLPYSGTAHDQLALRLAARLAQRDGADLTLLHVVRPGRTAPRLEREARQLLETVAPEPMTGHHTRLLVIETDRAVDAVLSEAKRHDMTVLGVGEEWELAPHLFGLRSERIAVENPSSLLIVRAAGRRLA
jgi:Kef-type K+ transport system membrane component KefB/nucleotide-binding universal stress UspA family protein